MLQAVESAAAGVIGGILYVAGGFDRNLFSSVAKLQIYDPIADSWTLGPDMPSALSSLTGGVVNGHLYVTGGSGSSGLNSQLYRYDPIANAWTTGPAMPTARTLLGGLGLGDTLYTFGGSSASGTSATVEAFAPAAVPEPHSAAFCLCVLVAGVVLRRRVRAPRSGTGKNSAQCE